MRKGDILAADGLMSIARRGRQGCSLSPHSKYLDRFTACWVREKDHLRWS